MDSEPSSLLLDHTQDKIAVLDDDGAYTYVNAGGERILGFEESELVGEVAFEYLHPEDRESVEKTFHRTVERGEAYASETVRYRHRTSDGSWVWLESRLSNVDDEALEGYIISSREVTAQVEAERKRRESETTLRELANATDDVLWMFSADWNELLFCNPTYETLFGQSIERLEEDPQHFLEAVHPEDVPAVEEAMERLSAGHPVDVEYRVNAERNYDRWVWVKGEPLTEDGEVVRVVGFSRDVTHRKRRERQLAVMDDLLRHNLRNELSVILSRSELLEEIDAETTDHVEVIRRAGERLLDTAAKQREIVEFLQESEAPKALDVSGMVAESVATMNERYPTATIETDVESGTNVSAVEEFEAGLRELVENAIRHCGHEQPVVSVSSTTSSTECGEVEIVVADNCQPLPEFDHGVLTGEHEMDAVYHSSGCGLWLVYWTVDLSGGDIDYTYDDGNVVTIRLPSVEV